MLKQYFTKGHKKQIIKYILLFFAFSITIYLTTMFALTPKVKQINSPCKITIINQTVQQTTWTQNISQIHLFITKTKPHTKSSSCIEKSLSQNQQIQIDKYKITSQKNTIQINNITLNTNQSWHDQKLEFSLKNPWWVYINEFQLQNHGKIKARIMSTTHIQKFKNQPTLITGHLFSRATINPLTTFLYSLCIAILSLIIILQVYFSIIKTKTTSKNN